MNQILQNKIIPESWKMAEVIIINKENTDPTDVRNYRPISLLNMDYEIFTNILSDRLKIRLNDWIGEEQTGFLPNRNIRDNVRMILDIIEYYETNHQKELALLSLNAEKAFDNLSWDFVQLLLEEFDIGFQFKNVIQAIYHDQKAKIIINGQMTNEFSISKGTRQGCPLSPLIFILV